MSVDTHEEKQAGYQVSFSATLHSIALRQGLSLAQTLDVGLDWMASNTLRSSCFLSSMLGLHNHARVVLCGH